MRRHWKSRKPAGQAVSAQLPPLASLAGGRGSLSYSAAEEAYLFEAPPVRYRVTVDEAAQATGLLRIEGCLEEKPWLPLVTAAGMSYRTRQGDILSPEQFAAARHPLEFRHAPRGLILTLRYAESVGEQVLRRTLQLRLAGRALSIQVSSPGTQALGNYCGFRLGPFGPPERREIRLPYAPEPLWLLPGGGFLAGYLDPWQSAATASLPDDCGTFYRPRTDGRISHMEDTFFLAYSDDPLAPLPSPQREPSTHQADLAKRLLLDVWSDLPYTEDQRFFEQLCARGLTDVALVYRCWQQFGYDRRPPCFYPADPGRGRNEEFRRLVEQTTVGGWLCALREDYSAISPDCSYWDPKVVARDSEGNLRPARGSGYAIAADKMIEFARLETTKIQRNYRSNATFAGSHVAWRPEEGLHQLDADAANDRAQTLRDGLAAAESLVRFLGEVHEGPALAAGGQGPERLDTLAPGMADGSERPLEGGRCAPVIPDYELRVVKPMHVGYGLGDYASFFGVDAGAFDPGRADWDVYRATEIAFGHGGYLRSLPVGERWLPAGSMERAVSEYFLLRALQEQYLTAAVRTITYRDREEMIPLAEALRRNLDLTQAQVRLEYANGLTVWVNRHARENWVVGIERAQHTLPPGGWLAVNPRLRFLAYSALVAGNRADVCLAADYQFMNPRGTTLRRIEGITADGAAALLRTSVAGRRDLVLVGGRSLVAEADTLRLSERGDARLRHRSAREIEIHVFDSESGKPIHVTLTAYSGPWRTGKIEVQQWVEDEWRPAPNQVQQTKFGPQLGRAFPGVRYRLVATAP